MSTYTLKQLLNIENLNNKKKPQKKYKNPSTSSIEYHFQNKNNKTMDEDDDAPMKLLKEMLLPKDNITKKQSSSSSIQNNQNIQVTKSNNFNNNSRLSYSRESSDHGLNKTVKHRNKPKSYFEQFQSEKNKENQKLNQKQSSSQNLFDQEQQFDFNSNQLSMIDENGQNNQNSSKSFHNQQITPHNLQTKSIHFNHPQSSSKTKISHNNHSEKPSQFSFQKIQNPNKRRISRIIQQVQRRTSNSLKSDKKTDSLKKINQSIQKSDSKDFSKDKEEKTSPTTGKFFETQSSYVLKNRDMLPFTQFIQEKRSRHYHEHRNPEIRLTFANNLNKIIFKYSGGHASTLYNYSLKIKNQTPCRVLIKIKCTNPKHYEVRPNELTLQYQQIAPISIQMKLYPHDISPQTLKHDLTRYQNDKFKICYCVAQLDTQVQYQQGSKVLPIQIQSTEQQRLRADSILKNQKTETQKLAIQQKQIQIYKKLCEKNIAKMGVIDDQIKQVQKQLKCYWLGFVTKNVFVFTGIIGAMVGFWMG